MSKYIAIYTILLPFISFCLTSFINVLLRNFANKKPYSAKIENISNNFSKAVNSVGVGVSLIFSVIIAVTVFKSQQSNLSADTNPVVHIFTLFEWFKSGALQIKWQIRIDSLVAVMLVVVNLVSFLVHIYSISYMSADKSIARFMSFLSLFTFFMLALVTSNNFLQLFFGWEGVGLASYLLIGFWFNKNSANNASIKAFITNRIGDLGLIIAISLIYKTFGTLDFDPIFNNVANYHLTKIYNSNFSIIDLISLALFIGAMGKSAQIILHIWLADAMEGPTPVSALIHAATMVTAGVFLVVRCSYIFEYSPLTLSIIATIGVLTAVFAATIAITQNDIKKIIAYSTCSQLGYMFFACGLSAYSAAIFHLATHAFFKALLFLCAGSVIHGLHHQQNIQEMGGLAKKMPLTCATMWLGSLALAGFPPLAGYFSKDLILEVAFQSHSEIGKIAYFGGLFAAFLTAFYSWRLLFLVFHGNYRGKEKYYLEAHESPFLITFPLIILSIGAIFSGLFAVKFLNLDKTITNFIDVIFLLPSHMNVLEEAHHSPVIVKFSAIIVGVLAIIISYIFYIRNKALPNYFAKKFSKLYRLSLNKWYFDEFYQKFIISPIFKLSNFLWQFVDLKVIDKISFLLVASAKNLSKFTGNLQTGLVFNNLLATILGMVAIFGFALFFFFKLFTNL